MQKFYQISGGKIVASKLSESAPDASWLPAISDSQPSYDAATEMVVPGVPVIEQTRVRFTWQVVTLPLDVIAKRAEIAEREAIRAMIADLAADNAEADADQAKAQAFIDIASPTNAQRNEEVLDAAKRGKRAAKREQRLIRIIKQLIKDNYR